MLKEKGIGLDRKGSPPRAIPRQLLPATYLGRSVHRNSPPGLYCRRMLQHTAEFRLGKVAGMVTSIEASRNSQSCWYLYMCTYWTMRMDNDGYYSVTCLECGREFCAVTWTHLKFVHGMTIGNYRYAHPDAPLQSDYCIELRVTPPQDGEGYREYCEMKSEVIQRYWNSPVGRKRRGLGGG